MWRWPRRSECVDKQGNITGWQIDGVPKEVCEEFPQPGGRLTLGRGVQSTVWAGAQQSRDQVITRNGISTRRSSGASPADHASEETREEAGDSANFAAWLVAAHLFADKSLITCNSAELEKAVYLNSHSAWENDTFTDIWITRSYLPSGGTQ
jgi:hypothetical protein